jgi:hypothetical protein
MTGTNRDHRTSAQRQEAVLDALSRGATIAQAATEARVSSRTVRAYLATPEFQHHLRTRRATTAALTTATLTHYTVEAVQRLHTLMTDPHSSPATIARAATTLLSEARAWRDTDLEERLTALEQAAEHTTLRAVQ